MNNANLILKPIHQKSSQISSIRPFLLLFLAALLIRLSGILWGGVNPDEAFGAAVKVLAGQIVPDTHYYPPLLYYQ